MPSWLYFQTWQDSDFISPEPFGYLQGKFLENGNPGSNQLPTDCSGD